MNVKEKAKFQLIMTAALIITALAIIYITASCRSKVVNNADNFSYQTIEIQGMTCIRWSFPIAYQGGLTCNWDEWERAR